MNEIVIVNGLLQDKIKQFDFKKHSDLYQYNQTEDTYTLDLNSGIVDITFVDCTFEQAFKIEIKEKLPVNVIIFNGCTFNQEVFIDMFKNDAYVYFKNCTFSDKSIECNNGHFIFENLKNNSENQTIMLLGENNEDFSINFKEPLVSNISLKLDIEADSININDENIVKTSDIELVGSLQGQKVKLSNIRSIGNDTQSMFEVSASELELEDTNISNKNYISLIYHNLIANNVILSALTGIKNNREIYQNGNNAVFITDKDLNKDFKNKFLGLIQKVKKLNINKRR